MQTHTPFGYVIINGKPEISPETSHIVGFIFKIYLEGISTYQIAKNLTNQGILNASHKPSWNHGSIGKILENRKYMGDNFYPLLIEPEVFEKVQHRRQEQANKLGRTLQPNSFRNQTVLSGTLYCGICGETYRRYVEHCNKPSESIKWKCKHYIKGNRVSCRNIFLEDDVIKRAFIRVINHVIANPELVEKRRRLKTPLPSPAAEKLDHEIQTSFKTGQYTEDEIRRLVFDRAREKYHDTVIDDTDYQTDKLRQALSEKGIQAGFEEKLFQQTVQKIVVQPEGRLQFKLRNGKLLIISINEI